LKNKPTVAVVILNWNGKSWLEKFLPSVIRHSTEALIFVADNASTDDSVEFLISNYPNISIIRNTSNSGFAGGYNQALKSVKADYYILLNSDVEVSENWIQPLIRTMETDKSIAACMPKILDYNNRSRFEYAGASGGFMDNYGYPFCRGRIFDSLEEDVHQHDTTIEIFWATGACMFVRASAFWEVNGFDEDFFAHMEEIDLCWRLKNKGYKIFSVPESEIYHVGGGTLQSTNPEKTYLNFRNSLITLTKNNFSGGLFWKILVRLLLDGVAGLKFLAEGKIKHCFAIVRAHWAYFTSLKKTFQKRNQQKTSVIVFDFSQVLNKSIVYLYFIKRIKTFKQLEKYFR
jgi:GT2 family glycosyltransferase